MDEFDNGYLTYDDNYPPICIKPTVSSKYNSKRAMSGIVLNYLKDSHKNGIKHPNTVLDSGMTAGEVAVYHLRNTHNEKTEKKQNSKLSKTFDIFQKLMEMLENDMDIDMRQNEHIFVEYVNPDTFSNGTIDNLKLLPSIKAFLNHINKKDKGYTLKLNNLVHRFFSTVLNSKM
jgi:hypothetical protein